MKNYWRKSIHFHLYVVTQCCGQEGQFQSAIEVEAVINERHRSGSLIFFTGDLNVQDGLENSKTIR